MEAARTSGDAVRRKAAAKAKARRNLDALISGGAVTAPRVDRSARLPERIVRADAELSAIVIEQRG